MYQYEYDRVAREIAQDLANRGAGATVPPESEIATRFNVARGTVVRAIEALKEAGWLFEAGPGRQRRVWRVGNQPAIVDLIWNLPKI